MPISFIKTNEEKKSIIIVGDTNGCIHLLNLPINLINTSSYEPKFLKNLILNEKNKNKQIYEFTKNVSESDFH